MVQIRAALRMRGPAFSAKAVTELTGIPFTNCQEPGAVSQRGRYAHEPSPYGSAEYAAREDAAFLDGLDDEFFAAATKLVDAARKVGAEEVLLHVDVEHDGQCNLELAPRFLLSAHRLGVPLTMTCYRGL